jgi:biotin operon repressor
MMGDDMATTSDELLRFFKALADANRLKIVGLLARQPYSGEELAALLGLKASTISHHLARLAQAGLVSARAEGYYNIYQLEESALQRVRRLFSKGDLVEAASRVDADGYDRKVLGDFLLPSGRLKEIPAQRKKREVLLRHVAGSFKAGRRYSEKQVNEMLSNFHADTASLRRELVAAGIMEREGGGGDYWLKEG